MKANAAPAEKMYRKRLLSKLAWRRGIAVPVKISSNPMFITQSHGDDGIVKSLLLFSIIVKFGMRIDDYFMMNTSSFGRCI